MSPLDQNFKRVGDGVFITQGRGDENPAFLIAFGALGFIKDNIPIALPHGYDRRALQRLCDRMGAGPTRIDSKQAQELVAIGKELLKRPEIEQFEIDAINHLQRVVEDAKHTPYIP